MKKFLVTLIIIGGMVGAYFWVSTKARLSIAALEGVTVEVTRGDLEIPITASGNIQPASITQIKGKATGEVVELPFEEGSMVQRGDFITLLDKIDEQRNVERAKADYTKALIAVELAKIRRKQAEEVGIPLAAAKLKQMEARVLGAVSRYEYMKPTTQPADARARATPQQEWDQILSAKLEAEASILAAQAEVEQARIAVDLAEEEVKTADENLKAADAVYKDAKQRLQETEVVSPIDGMILSRKVQIGQVVQSGKTSIMGGDVLMEIADVSRIYAVVNVDEADIAEVHELAPKWARPGGIRPPESLGNGALEEGTRVRVTVESFRDEDFHGIIERIAPQAEERAAIATFRVWIPITSENRDKLIPLLNTQAEAHFTAQSVKEAVLVSYDAIHLNPNGEGWGVYLPVREGEDPEPQFRQCVTGLDNGIQVEILNGCVEPGDKVYTRLPQRTRRERESKN